MFKPSKGYADFVSHFYFITSCISSLFLNFLRVCGHFRTAPGRQIFVIVAHNFPWGKLKPRTVLNTCEASACFERKRGRNEKGLADFCQPFSVPLSHADQFFGL